MSDEELTRLEISYGSWRDGPEPIMRNIACDMFRLIAEVRRLREAVTEGRDSSSDFCKAAWEVGAANERQRCLDIVDRMAAGAEELVGATLAGLAEAIRRAIKAA